MNPERTPTNNACCSYLNPNPRPTISTPPTNRHEKFAPCFAFSWLNYIYYTGNTANADYTPNINNNHYKQLTRWQNEFGVMICHNNNATKSRRPTRANTWTPTHAARFPTPLQSIGRVYRSNPRRGKPQGQRRVGNTCLPQRRTEPTDTGGRGQKSHRPWQARPQPLTKFARAQN